MTYGKSNFDFLFFIIEKIKGGKKVRKVMWRKKRKRLSICTIIYKIKYEIKERRLA